MIELTANVHREFLEAAYKELCEIANVHENRLERINRFWVPLIHTNKGFGKLEKAHDALCAACVFLVMSEDKTAREFLVEAFNALYE